MHQNKLNVVLCWHMHQPQYRCNGIYTRPWTWLHAIKDYTDMAAHLKRVASLSDEEPALLDCVRLSPHRLRSGRRIRARPTTKYLSAKHSYADHGKRNGP